MIVIELVLAVVIGYAVTVFADYLIHRNIWHGRWRVVYMSPFRWLLYPHYVHHLRAHHLHAARHRELLTDGVRVPSQSRTALEDRYADQWEVHYGLRCTEHGITIRGLHCVAHYLLVFWFTPQPYVALLLWWALGPVAGAIAMTMPLIAVCTQILHAYYHMSASARAERAPRLLRWAVTSSEFDRLAREHLEHHYDPTRADDYYGVLPLGHLLLRPLLGKN